MAHREYEEKRYCVEVTFVSEIDCATRVYRYYFDNFFDAVERAKSPIQSRFKPDDVNLFDYAAGRTLFELADLS